MRCAFTGRPLADPSDGIWDDGEWMSWDFINQHLEDRELRAEFPLAELRSIHAFLDLVEAAQNYHALTGRYLEIWGELGELYAEVKYGLKRHRIHAAGSDGRIGNDFVEVKTISPGKGNDVVHVKRAGNFSKLLLVKISADLAFEARVIDRKKIPKGLGSHARVRWDACREMLVG